MFNTRMGVAPPDVPPRDGCHARAAAARRDGAGLVGPREDGGPARAAARVRLHPERRRDVHWQPEGEGRLETLSPTLSPLAPFQDQVVVPIGLSQKQAEALGDGNGEHSRAGTVFLSGVHPKERKAPTCATARRPTRSPPSTSAATRRSGRWSWRWSRPTSSATATTATVASTRTASRADADHAQPARDEPAHRLPADVRRRRLARGPAGADAGGPQHPRLGAGRRRGAQGEARSGRPQQRERVPRLRARGRAAPAGGRAPARRIDPWSCRTGRSACRSPTTSTRS